MTAVDMIHFKLAHNGETRRFILPYLPYLDRRILDRLHVRVRSIVVASDFKLMWKTGLPDGDIPLETVNDLSAAFDYAFAMAEPSMPPCVHLEVVFAASKVENDQQTEIKTAADLPECDSDDEDIGPYCTIQASQPALHSPSERPIHPPRPSKSVCRVGFPALLDKSGKATLPTEESSDDESVYQCLDHPQQRPRKIGVELSSVHRNSCDSQSTIGVLTEPIPLMDENIRLKKELKKVKKELEEYRMKTVEMRLAEVERRLKELENKDADYKKRDMEMISEIQYRMDGMNKRIEVLEDRH